MALTTRRPPGSSSWPPSTKKLRKRSRKNSPKKALKRKHRKKHKWSSPRNPGERMAAAKIRVSDIAKRMGKSEKDVIFQLQSLGAEISDPNQALEPEVIQALITGKKLTTRSRSVIMREDKPQPEKAKKEAVRPPRPIVKPTPRAKAAEAPKEETPPAPAPPSVIIPEFVQAAEDEERAAKEAPAPAPVAAAPSAPQPTPPAPEPARTPT